MRAAVIDLGTNTFHLIIADLGANGIKVLYKTNVPVRLGEGRLNDNVIIPAAFERGINTLKAFRETIDRWSVDCIRATATSAVRSAQNGQEFVQAAGDQAGIAIDVINGDQEATYIYQGVKATGVIKETSLIMDIGGGSTEFIICNADTLIWKKSYDIGAARLMQAYFKSDPINLPDQESILQRVEGLTPDLTQHIQQYQPKTLIGSAGAFETFAGMIHPQLDLKSIASTPIPLPEYHTLAAKLIASTHTQRSQMEGLIPLRVDMIVMASLLTNYVLSSFNLQQMYLSTYDLKMGVMQSILEENRNH